MTNAGSDWTVIVTRPGGSPMENLIDSILTQDGSFNERAEEEKESYRAMASTVLRSSSLGLSDVVQQMTKGARKNIFVLIVKNGLLNQTVLKE